MPEIEEMTQEQGVSQQENVPNSVDYIEAIKEMKKNTVDKEAYNKLKEENKQLLDSLVNGKTLEEEVHEEPVDIDQLRNDLFADGSDLSNLEFATKSLKLREAIIAQGGVDPFVPYGKNILPTDEDMRAAEKVANVLQECIEIAEGNSDVFTTELQKRLVDTAPVRNNKRR